MCRSCEQNCKRTRKRRRRAAASRQEDVHWLEISLREEYVVDFQQLASTALQYIDQIVRYKARQESITSSQLSPEAIAEGYRTKAKMAAGCEAITKEFVTNALAIHSQLLSIRKVSEVMKRAEESWGQQSPFNSVNKLRLMLTKLRLFLQEFTVTGRTLTLEKMAIWFVEYVVDQGQVLSAAGASLDDLGFSSTNLKAQEGSTRANFVWMVCYKYVCLHYLLGQWLDGLAIPAEIKHEIRCVFDNHTSYRQHFALHAGEEDLLWQGGWPGSAVRCASIIQEVCYAKSHDQLLKSLLRRRGVVSEMFEGGNGSLDVLHNQLKEALDHEKIKLAEQESWDRGRDRSAPTAEGGTDNEEDETGILRQLAKHGDLLPKVADTIRKLDEDGQVRLSTWHAEAHSRFKSCIRLVVEPPEAPGEADAFNSKPCQIASTRLPNCRVPNCRIPIGGRWQVATCIKDFPQATEEKDGTVVVWWYDTKVAGEANSHPHLRSPAFRATHFTKHLQGFMLTRDVPTQLQVNDRHVVFCGLGARCGEIGQKISNCYKISAGNKDNKDIKEKPIKRAKTVVNVMYSEEAILTKRYRGRGVGVMNQNEEVHILSQKKLDGPTRPRLYHDGTTIGTTIGPAGFPLHSELQQITVGQKNELYGTAGKVNTPPEDGEVEESQGARKRKASDLEPAFFHSSKGEIYEEVLNYFGRSNKQIAAVVDATPGASAPDQAS